MGLMRSLKRTTFPSLKEVQDIPTQLRISAKNQKLNRINVRFWDRHYKRPRNFIGEIDNSFGIPIVYFANPLPLAGILFDDVVYQDEQNELWVEFVEDYAFGLDRNSELAFDLNQQYYNDYASGRIKQQLDEDQYKAYKIPVLLNRIPREVIKIDSRAVLNPHSGKYVVHKIELTMNIIRLMSKVRTLEKVGKNENSSLIVGVALGGMAGIIAGIIISFAFLMG